jgi:hypothetical protein
MRRDVHRTVDATLTPQQVLFHAIEFRAFGDAA